MTDTRAKILAAMPGTRPELAEKAGVPYLAAARMVERLIRDKLAHVSGWVAGHPGRPVAIISAGPAAPAPAPAKSVAALRVATSRAAAKKRAGKKGGA